MPCRASSAGLAECEAPDAENLNYHNSIKSHEEMDSTDQKLVNLLTADPRMHLNEIAHRLGISKQAVHHRIQVLKERGALKGTSAGISFAYLNAVPVAVFGRSNAASAEDVMDKLGESEFTRRVVVAGGNYLYAVGELRRISELDKYAEFVRRTAEMPEPTVGIYCLEDVPMPDYHVDGIIPRKECYRPLSDLDISIIASLRRDARASVAEIAEKTGASAKTVKRHLDSMTADGSLELYAVQDAPVGGHLLLIIHIDLRDGAQKTEVARRLLSNNPSLDAYVRAFSNLPSFLVMVFWSESMTEIRSVLRNVSKDEGVESAVMNIGYLERVYDSTWRDTLLDDWARQRKKIRARSTSLVQGARRA